MRLIDADELIIFGLDNPDDEHLFQFVPIEIIDSAPTVELPSAQRWIPCSERLPDREGEYLVTWGTINVRGMCVLHYDQWGDWTDEYDNIMDGSNVIAWMPLPEPYKEVEQ